MIIIVTAFPIRGSMMNISSYRTKSLALTWRSGNCLEEATGGSLKRKSGRADVVVVVWWETQASNSPAAGEPETSCAWSVCV